MSTGGIMQAIDLTIIYDGSNVYHNTFGEISTNSTPWFSITVTGGAIVTISATTLDSGSISIKAISTL